MVSFEEINVRKREQSHKRQKRYRQNMKEEKRVNSVKYVKSRLLRNKHQRKYRMKSRLNNYNIEEKLRRYRILYRSVSVHYINVMIKHFESTLDFMYYSYGQMKIDIDAPTVKDLDKIREFLLLQSENNFFHKRNTVSMAEITYEGKKYKLEYPCSEYVQKDIDLSYIAILIEGAKVHYYRPESLRKYRGEIDSKFEFINVYNKKIYPCSPKTIVQYISFFDLKSFKIVSNDEDVTNL